MPSFTLHLNRRNRIIAETIRRLHDVKIRIEDGRIQVSFDCGLDLSLFDFDEEAVATRDHWMTLEKEIRKTLKDAKIRKFNPALISITPLRTKGIFIQITRPEKQLIKKAAEISGTTISDFVRTAILNVAGNALNEETARRMEKKAEEKARQEERKTKAYVS